MPFGQNSLRWIDGLLSICFSTILATCENAASPMSLSAQGACLLQQRPHKLGHEAVGDAADREWEQWHRAGGVSEEHDRHLLRLFGNLSMARRVHFPVDLVALRKDVAALGARFGHGSLHHGYQACDGWRVISLRSCLGDLEIDKECAQDAYYMPTDAWDASSYIRMLLAPIEETLERVRVSNLLPGQEVRWHRDAEIPFQSGQPADLHAGYVTEFPVCRLHLIVTNPPGAHLRLGTQFLHMRPGEMWCGDFSLPHALYNDGQEVRTTVLVDVQIKPTVLRRSPLGQEILKVHDAMASEKDAEGRGRSDNWRRMIGDFHLDFSDTLSEVPPLSGGPATSRLCQTVS